MTDKVQKIREEVERIQLYTQSEVLKQVLDYIDEVQKEPVSNVWHDAKIDPPQAKKKILATNEYGTCKVDYAINMALYWPKVIKWAYIDDLLNFSNVERTVKNWKDAQGDDLPIFDREVIVLIKYNAQRNIHDEEYPTYRVGFGHRPNPNGWDGKSIATGKVEHYTPKTYDKGGWNAPDIAYWLDVELPKEIEL